MKKKLSQKSLSCIIAIAAGLYSVKDGAVIIPDLRFLIKLKPCPKKIKFFRIEKSPSKP